MHWRSLALAALAAAERTEVVVFALAAHCGFLVFMLGSQHAGWHWHLPGFINRVDKQFCAVSLCLAVCVLSIAYIQL